jgi:hypothetical protein
VSTPSRRVGFSRRDWLTFAVPPAAWIGQLLLLYLLVPVACEQGTRAPLLAVTAVALAAAVVAVAAMHRASRGADGGDGAGDHAGIAKIGRIQGGVFVLAIVAAGAAAVWIDPCA